MLIASTQLIHLPIMDHHTHQRLGTVSDFVFDPDLGKLAALAIKPVTLFTKPKYLSAKDIESYEPYAIITCQDCLVNLEELVWIEKMILSKRPIFKQKAQTANKKPLGNVSEIYFDDNTNRIVQLHTQNLLNKRILNFNDVLEINKKAVIFKNDVLLVKEGQRQPAISAEINPA